MEKMPIAASVYAKPCTTVLVLKINVTGTVKGEKIASKHCRKLNLV